MPANKTEHAVGASTWASGNHIWMVPLVFLIQKIKKKQAIIKSDDNYLYEHDLKHINLWYHNVNK